MTCRLLLAIFICSLTVSCSSGAEHNFEKIVHRVDEYFLKEPTLLTSTKMINEGNEIYAYYALKISGSELSHDTKRTHSSISPYSGFITIYCSALNNAKHGNLISDTIEFQTELGITSDQAKGFSTTQMALINTDFSAASKCMINIRYSFQDNDWTYNGIYTDISSDTFIEDLKTFPQNKEFREAIGMTN